MFSSLIASTPDGEKILYWIEWAALIIEVVAVLIIVVAIINALSHYVYRAVIRPEGGDHYQMLVPIQMKWDRSRRNLRESLPDSIPCVNCDC